MTGGSAHEVLGRARRDAARLDARRAELRAQRDAIDLELESLDTQFTRVNIVIEYCENGPGDEPGPGSPPAEDASPDTAAATEDTPAWGRQPDRNGQGMTRAEVARRMLAEGLPLAPRTIAEAFHGTDRAGRGQVESIRRVLRRLVKCGFASVLPDGTYIVAGQADEPQEPAPTARGAQPEPALEPAAAATSARGNTWTPRLITGQDTRHASAEPRARAAGRYPFAVSAEVLLQLLATAARPMRALELAQALGRDPSDSQLESIRQTLRRCVARGQAVLVEPGMWAIAQPLAAEGRASI